MTNSKADEPEITLNAEPDNDPNLATAVGVYDSSYVKPDGKQEQAAANAPSNNGPPIPVGHARFYCEKCRTVSI